MIERLVLILIIIDVIMLSAIKLLNAKKNLAIINSIILALLVLALVSICLIATTGQVAIIVACVLSAIPIVISLFILAVFFWTFVRDSSDKFFRV